MCTKFHCPASALTLCCKDGKGEVHSSSDIESQKTLANSDGTIIKNNLLYVRRRG